MHGKKIRKIWLAAIAVSIVLLIQAECLPIQPDQYEPNNEFADASDINLGLISATIEPDDDVDYYRFNVPGEGDVKLSFDLVMPAGLQPELNFYSPQEEYLGGVRTDNPGDQIHSTLSVPAGDVVARVRSLNYESSPAEYSLNIVSSQPTANN
jgi:hypothetical protein